MLSAFIKKFINEASSTPQVSPTSFSSLEQYKEAIDREIAAADLNPIALHVMDCYEKKVHEGCCNILGAVAPEIIANDLLISYWVPVFSMAMKDVYLDASSDDIRDYSLFCLATFTVLSEKGILLKNICRYIPFDALEDLFRRMYSNNAKPEEVLILAEKYIEAQDPYITNPITRDLFSPTPQKRGFFSPYQSVEKLEKLLDREFEKAQVNIEYVRSHSFYKPLVQKACNFTPDTVSLEDFTEVLLILFFSSVFSKMLKERHPEWGDKSLQEYIVVVLFNLYKMGYYFKHTRQNCSLEDFCESIELDFTQGNSAEYCAMNFF